MILERYYRRRRWIVGSVVVSIAVVTMLLAPPPRMVSVHDLFQDFSPCLLTEVGISLDLFYGNNSVALTHALRLDQGLIAKLFTEVDIYKSRQQERQAESPCSSRITSSISILRETYVISTIAQNTATDA